MATVRIVPTFDELEERQTGRGARAKGAAVQEFALQSSEKALAQGVVETISDRTRGRTDTCPAATLAEGKGGILTALVTRMNNVLRAALVQCHLEGIEHQFGPQMRGHGPAHHAAPRIKDDRQKVKACPRWHVGNVRDPKLIGAGCREVALD